MSEAIVQKLKNALTDRLIEQIQTKDPAQLGGQSAENVQILNLMKKFGLLAVKKEHNFEDLDKDAIPPRGFFFESSELEGEGEAPEWSQIDRW